VALEDRLEAVQKAEPKSKLAVSAKKYGLEVLMEEKNLLSALALHYKRQREEAAIEHAELDRIERMVSGDTVPVAKPSK
jgi:hypothetical protein